MFLVAWWLTGVFLGWFIWTFYRIWRSERQWQSFGADLTRWIDATRRPLVAPAITILRTYLDKEPAQDDGPDRLGRLSAEGARFVFAAGLAIALAVVVFAALTDHAQLDNYTLAIKMYLTGVRVQALLVGILSGLFFSRYRVKLQNLAGSVADAVIGSKGNTAWALQGALAVGLIAIGLFALRPDLFQYLRSFKFGTVEATFGDQGPLPLRDARLNLAEFRERVAVKQYRNFKEEFMAKESARGFARNHLTGQKNADIQAVTGEIASDLFETFVNPVLTSILCLDEVRALRTAVHDHDLAAYAATWEDFLRKLHDDKIKLTPDNLTSFLSQLSDLSVPFVARVRRLNSSCMKSVANILPSETIDASGHSSTNQGVTKAHQDAAKKIFDLYEKAVSLLKNREYDTRPIISLVVFEPYLTGAVSDLIALISGEREKTDFLLNMLDGFPLSNDLVTPGIINLYYQVTYSWLNSTGSLPLDLVRLQIEYAARGADIMMARSADWLSKNNKGNSASPDADGDAGRAAKVYDIFLRNLFAILTNEVDVYVQRALADERISEEHRQSWIKAASRLHGMLQLRLGIPMAELDGLNRIELDERMKGRLRADTRSEPDPKLPKIDPDFLLQADLAMALSAILIQDGSRASARNCSAALIYLNEATAALQPTIEDNKLDKSQEFRLRQLIGAVANRIGASCDWIDSRGQWSGPKPSNVAEAGAK